MVDTSLLFAGIDIPFRGARTVIHCPTIQEILVISESKFFQGCEFLNFSKEILSDKDKIALKDISNFQIFMSIINDRSKSVKKILKSVIAVLELLFPNYILKFSKDKIRLIDEQNNIEYYICESNFEEFKDIISSMFCLKKHNEDNDFNPVSQIAKEIAEKIKRGRAQAAAASKNNQKISILNRYASILAIGLNINLSDILTNWTVYQLYDQFERYQLKMGYDMYIQAKLAGAKDLKEVDNWMDDIHSDI